MSRPKISHAATFQSEGTAWQEQRNAADGLIDRQFASYYARVSIWELNLIRFEENTGLRLKLR